MRGITAGLLIGLLLPLPAAALSNRTPLTDTELEAIAVQPEEEGRSTIAEAVRHLVENEPPLAVPAIGTQRCLPDDECGFDPTDMVYVLFNQLRGGVFTLAFPAKPTALNPLRSSWRDWIGLPASWGLTGARSHSGPF